MLAVCLTSVGSHASASPSKARGGWPLVSLAALGTVTWRCDPNRHPGLALGYHSTGPQTGSIRLRVRGHTILKRTIEPGQWIRLPYLRVAVQRLRVTEFGEDGTLSGSVRVDFSAHSTSSFCWWYAPPRVDVHLVPRR